MGSFANSIVVEDDRVYVVNSGDNTVQRYDAGSGAEPYVGGTLLAAKAAPALEGLTRGLDTLLFGPSNA